MEPLPITNPYIRDKIVIDEKLNHRLSLFTGGGPVYLLAREVQLQTDFDVGTHAVVVVADEVHGNGRLINANGQPSHAHGDPGRHAAEITPGQESASGENGGDGGFGGPAGSVTVMCRHSDGVRISASGGAGAAGGAGGNGNGGSAATVIPAVTKTVVTVTPEGLPIEEVVEVTPATEIPGTLGGFGGGGGNGGAGGNGGTIRFTSITNASAPVLEAFAGAGGPGGMGGQPGPHGAFAEIPPDFDNTPFPAPPGANGAEGTVEMTTVSEDEYVAGLRPLLDATGPSFANHWAPYRLVVGQHYYRKFRESTPGFGQQAAVEFARTLELQHDNADALRWRDRLLDNPRRQDVGRDDVTWESGGLNALGLPRDLDVRPHFAAFSEAFSQVSPLVLNFLAHGTKVLSQADVGSWQEYVEAKTMEATRAQKLTDLDHELAATEVRHASDAIESLQSRLDQTTQDIQAALEEMKKQDDVDILGVVGNIASVAAAVVAVVAAVPSFGASLVALAPAMVALTNVVMDTDDPLVKLLFEGDEKEAKKIKAAAEKVDKDAAKVVKGAKAIVDFVKVVHTLSKAKTTPDNSKHVALVRQGVQLTYELLLARHNSVEASLRLEVANARVAHAAQSVADMAAVLKALKGELAEEEARRRTALNSIAIAQSRADALLTLAFYAQRALEIYTLSDLEDEVPLDSGHLHPDLVRAYEEHELSGADLASALNNSWSGLTGMVPMHVRAADFAKTFPNRNQHRLSFEEGGLEVSSLKAHGRFSFRVDLDDLPDDHFDAKARGVRLALVGAQTPSDEVDCTLTHGAAYEYRLAPAQDHVLVLQARSSDRIAKASKLAADEGLGPDPLLTDPTSLSFWGRGLAGDYELSITDQAFEAGLDLSGVTEVQVWLAYQSVR